MKNLNAIHLNGLKALEAVGRLGSLATAAAELGVTTGAVSQQIGRAEAQLGRALFERTSRGLVPAPGAEALLAQLTDGFSVLSAAVASARRRDEGVLTISVAPILASRWLVHRLPSFSARCPEVRLRIEASDRFVAMGSGDVDVALRIARGGGAQWADAECEWLDDEMVFPVCTPALAEALATPADILKLPVIIDGPSVFGWDVWLKPAGLEGAALNMRHVFSDGSLCLDAAIGGQGVFLAWKTLASYALKNGQLVEPFSLRAPTGRSTYFVTPKGRAMSKTVRAFREWIREELSEASN
jgi:LysR family transcriptional regulator, glycine cleavage system transcriptional activator